MDVLHALYSVIEIFDVKVVYAIYPRVYTVKSCQYDRGLILSDLGSRPPFQKSIESLKKKLLFLNLFSIFKNPVCSIFHYTK